VALQQATIIACIVSADANTSTATMVLKHWQSQMLKSQLTFCSASHSLHKVVYWASVKSSKSSYVCVPVTYCTRRSLRRSILPRLLMFNDYGTLLFGNSTYSSSLMLARNMCILALSNCPAGRRTDDPLHTSRSGWPCGSYRISLKRLSVTYSSSRKSI